MQSLEDMKRLIPQNLRQAATEYEKGHLLMAERLIDSAINGINLVKEETEAASGACEVATERSTQLDCNRRVKSSFLPPGE